MYNIKYQRAGATMCPKLQPVYDNCCNYYMNRGLHVNGQFIDSVGIVSPLVGDIKQSVRATDYEGWLLCNGGEISIYQYAELYSLIGNSFGSAAPGFFKLPDARGRVLGTVQGSPGTSYYCVGNSTGEETHTLIVEEIPSHTHTVTDPGHTHTSNATGAQSIGGNGNGLAFSNGASTYSGSTDTSGGEPNLFATVAALTINSNTTGVTNQVTGGGLAHNNMQPTLFIGNTFIYSGVRDSRKEYVCTVEEQVIQPCND
jgi:microcystin-dependent protein